MSELNSTASVTAHKAFDTVLDTPSATLPPVLDTTPNRMLSDCRSYVRDKPLTIVGVAVASGFLLSWALRQR